MSHAQTPTALPELNFHQARIVITGGKGFLGSYVAQEFRRRGAHHVQSLSTHDGDLRDITVCQQLMGGADIVVHLAANVGGIGYNQAHPAELFYDNIVMGTHVLHEAWRAGVKKFVSIGTICAYPKLTPVPFREDDLWSGYPEETNAPYGLAKKMQLVQAQAYREQYGFNAIYLLPTNLYGPGDNFDEQQSHVIPALIRKFVEAHNTQAPEVVVWGTGAPTREFLFVEDAAHAIVLATERYNGAEPVNLGSQFEISIAELAHLIVILWDFEEKFVLTPVSQMVNQEEKSTRLVPKKSLASQHAQRLWMV
jgi:GDP-L-fucose synthase